MRPKRENMATVSLLCMPDGRWYCEIEPADDSPGPEWDGPTPGHLLDLAVKWCADRGLLLGPVILTEAYRLTEAVPVTTP